MKWPGLSKILNFLVIDNMNLDESAMTGLMEWY